MSATDLPRLPERQVEAGRLYARGLSYKAIGRELGIDPETARKHVTRLAHSLGGDGRTRERISRWFYGQDQGEERSA